MIYSLISVIEILYLEVETRVRYYGGLIAEYGRKERRKESPRYCDYILSIYKIQLFIII